MSVVGRTLPGMCLPGGRDIAGVAVRVGQRLALTATNLTQQASASVIDRLRPSTVLNVRVEEARGVEQVPDDRCGSAIPSGTSPFRSAGRRHDPHRHRFAPACVALPAVAAEEAAARAQS